MQEIYLDTGAIVFTMSENLALQKIAPLIHEIRGQRVIFDSDLARIYGVQVKALNQAVKRNSKRFPEDFAFQLTNDEWQPLRSQFATLKRGQHRKFLPHAFTEHGAIMRRPCSTADQQSK